MGVLVITEATKEQWQQIEELKQRWIDNTTKQHSHDSVVEIVGRMYESMDLPAPIVLQAPSPMAMVVWSAAVKKVLATAGDSLYSQLHSQLHSQLDSQLSSQLHSQLHSQLYSQLDSQLSSQLDSQLCSQLRSEPWYVGSFWRVWSGWYQGGKILGVDFDLRNLALLTDFNEAASIWCAHKGLCVVSKNPTECHWLEGDFHNENNAAVIFEDGYSAWSIRGVAVDEQIVKAGQTQSVKQIGDEQNAELKRIRIERFAGTNDPFDGWNRYRRESNAVEVNDRYNDSEGTYETLYGFPDGSKVLMPTCRTGRMFALEVPPEIKTCQQAQDYFWNSSGHRWGKSNCIGRS